MFWLSFIWRSLNQSSKIIGQGCFLQVYGRVSLRNESKSMSSLAHLPYPFRSDESLGNLLHYESQKQQLCYRSYLWTCSLLWFRNWLDWILAGSGCLFSSMCFDIPYVYWRWSLMDPSSRWNSIIILSWNFDSNFLSGPNVIFQASFWHPYPPVSAVTFRSF